MSRKQTESYSREMVDEKLTSITTRIVALTEDVRIIKENHLVHIEDEISALKTNVAWLVKYHWIVTTAAVGALVASLINLLVR